jgi:hypothetical protein
MTKVIPPRHVHLDPNQGNLRIVDKILVEVPYVIQPGRQCQDRKSDFGAKANTLELGTARRGACQWRRSGAPVVTVLPCNYHSEMIRDRFHATRYGNAPAQTELVVSLKERVPHALPSTSRHRVITTLSPPLGHL